MASTQETGVNIELVIEKLSTSGAEELDRGWVKQLKAYCKASNSGPRPEEAYSYLGRLVLHQLEKRHAQIRFGSLLIIEYLFERSHQFRLFICDNLNAFFELCADIKGFRYAATYDDGEDGEEDTDHSDRSRVTRKSTSTSTASKKALQPIAWAKKLRSKAIKCFQYWYNEFGSGYQALSNGYQFLQQKGVIDSQRNGATASSTSTSQRVHPSDQSSIQQFQLDQVSKEFEDIENDVNALTRQIDTCFDLLIPKFKVIEDADDDNFHFRPMQGLSFSIILNSKVEITRDSSNSDLIDNLKELCGELNKFYSGKLTQFDDNLGRLKLPLLADKVNDLISRTKCLKVKIGTIVWKFNEIDIICADNSPKGPEDSEGRPVSDVTNEDEEEEDDFEDVPDREDLFLLAKIEVEKEKQAKEQAAEGRRDMAGPSASTDDAGRLDENQCRATLPSGRLCPRRDKVKCPFHGPIIARDNEGLPVDAELRQREMDARFQQKADEWKDPKYLKRLSMETGRDLEGSMQKNKRKKYPNLIDIKKLANTPRKRLLRKISSKRVRERISSDLTALDEQAHRHFSEQWSYSLEN